MQFCQRIGSKQDSSQPPKQLCITPSPRACLCWESEVSPASWPQLKRSEQNSASPVLPSFDLKQDTRDYAVLCNKSKAFFFTVSHTAPLVDQVLYYVFPLSPTYMRPSCPWEASQQPARCCRVLHASANSEPLAEAPPCTKQLLPAVPPGAPRHLDGDFQSRAHASFRDVTGSFVLSSAA